MDTSAKTGIWIIATGVIVAFLYLGRDLLAPLAMAVFLFLVMEGFARAIDNRSRLIRRGVSRVISVLLVTLGFGLFIVLMARGVAQFGGQADLYERKINLLISDLYGLMHLSNAPTLSDLILGEPGRQLLGTLTSATGDLSEDLVLILLYVAFMFLAQSKWSLKLDFIFPDSARREQARRVGDAALRGIESYLWTQTVISVLTTLLTYVTLVLFGVQNALFLAALIFVLNYIPTLGSIVASVVPLLFVLVQPAVPDWIPGGPPQDTYIYAGLVFAGVSFWQFFFGNFVQPRMMGDSLNLSALVVLVSLAVWGAIWGIPGMFLSAPLTVLMMILFTQSPSTRWLAIVLSADGKPDKSQAEADISMNQAF
ncbi:MAG: AI-2E family transporter [Pseudomonadota bacterium]